MKNNSWKDNNRLIESYDFEDSAINFGISYCLGDYEPKDLFEMAYEVGIRNPHHKDDFQDWVRDQIDWDTFYDENEDFDSDCGDEFVFYLNDMYYEFLEEKGE